MNLAKLLSKNLIQNGIVSRFYYTNRVNQATLHSRISPLKSERVEAELEDWLKNGNQISSTECQRIVQDLRKKLHFPQALKDQDKTDKTYGALLNCYAWKRQTDKFFSHLQKMKELGFASSSLTYNDIMCLYTEIGQHEKLDEFEEAEKISKEWESSGNYYDFRIPKIVIVGYAEKGLHEKAEAMLEDLKGKGKHSFANTWVVVAKGYLDKGQVRKAFECVKSSLSLTVERNRWRPNLRVVTPILDWLGDEGSLQEVEDFVASLRPAAPVHRRMYVALLKANVRNGKTKRVDELLKLMKADMIDEDEEIKAILRMKSC
ncbi:hypothetical protein COLO4_31486 [Corchorus olitorius]|uniref:Pentatricopeptide repeat-containing protein n=1 Tax=Corchorus olitorius TaxID=93759 RepID=A0A1R3H484_9ROSI|nr:hypothetical protein COLO4_31486 [Corchorus olitorius]